MIYDIGILGGGPAGYAAAFEAVKNNMKVVLFEADKLGGTCLNRGCVPTKFLKHSADLYRESASSERYGIFNKGIDLKYDITMSEMNNVIKKLREGLECDLAYKNVNIVRGYAEIVNENIIKCEDILYEVNNVLIATGSKVDTSIIGNSITSDDVLALKKIPKKVKIIGGGVIAVEYANIFNKFGSDVTIAIRGERILRKWDRELAVSVTQVLKSNGIKIKTKCQMNDFLADDNDYLISAVGRKPRIDGIGNLNLEVDLNGAIIVDSEGRTNLDNIYAAGDVISNSNMLAHTAMEQGRRAVSFIAGKDAGEASAVANCIYISPEVASIGMTEAEAKEQHIDVVTGKQNMISNAMTLIYTDKRSFVKVVADRKNNRIIGAQIMCERASDIAGAFVVAINNKLTVKEFKKTVFPHPSFSEAIFDALNSLEEKINEY